MDQLQPRPPVDIAKLQAAVGNWSRTNFGDQVSAFAVIPMAALDAPASLNFAPNPGVAVGPLHPIIGIAEELGEFAGAANATERLDALADMGIYLLDLCSREGVDLAALGLGDWPESLPNDLDDFAGLVASVGRLSHAILKRSQGIRGMADDNLYARLRAAAIRAVWVHLNRNCAAEGEDYWDVITDTFTRIVKGRDWVNDPTNGAAG